MKIEEREYEENRKYQNWISRIDMVDILKFIAGMTVLFILRLIFLDAGYQ
jgi:hypothetical protein